MLILFSNGWVGYVDLVGTVALLPVVVAKQMPQNLLKITTSPKIFVTYKMAMPKMNKRQIFDCCNKVFIFCLKFIRLDYQMVSN